MSPSVRLAVIDNFDSFTYNLVQLLGELGAQVRVFRNNQVELGELRGHDGLVISPGPGTPNDAGISLDAITALSGTLPILGVCLGHQAIGQAFGASVVRTAPVHGKSAYVRHDYSGLFAGLADPFGAGRYHSLVVDRQSVPETLVVNAWTQDGLVMGLRHRSHPTYGVQFHPESILTKEGKVILQNFLRRCAAPRP